MARKHKNASERVEKKWSVEYINLLMKKLKEGNIEREYDVPVMENELKKRRD